MARYAPVFFLTVMTACTPLFAGDPAGPPMSGWRCSIGLSYMATTGNTSTTTGGLNFDCDHTGVRWKSTSSVDALRERRDGHLDAERFNARTQLTHVGATRWGLSYGAELHRDQFAGINLRSVLNLGAGATYGLNRRTSLDVNLGGTWTYANLRKDETRSTLGGLVAGRLTWRISPTATFKQDLELYPNFTDTTDYRIVAKTSLEASINKALALKLSYLVRYDNLPAPGKVSTDTTTTTSLVIHF
ncbi:MAG: DUF481 domain-containing protein [Acidobacteria bacterium]|nr:DUF481 domain-containing protein [Acidobacteriota bacterium]